MIGDFYDGDSFLSVLGTRQRFRELRTTRACGKGQDLLGASFQKQKVVVARQAFAPPLACQAALTQQIFVSV